jgi:hypothetical protein
MLATQHAETSASLLAISTRYDNQALAAARHTEVTINQASIQAFGREIQAKREQVAWEIARITKRLEATDIPDWYRVNQVEELGMLQCRESKLALEKTELERQYHLLAATDESVGARPSSC